MLTKRDTKLLIDALNAARLTKAQFSSDPKKDVEIKEAIRLYLQTWVCYPLEQIAENNKPAGIRVSYII